jgi:CBS-domain-containing membrane protein
MTTHVVVVRLNATYKDMTARPREFRVSAFPVLDDDNKVIGVVSEADLLDNVIVGIVLTDPARFSVTVKDGVVTVEGQPENASVGRDMIEEIRHVEAGAMTAIAFVVVCTLGIWLVMVYLAGRESGRKNRPAAGPSGR